MPTRITLLTDFGTRDGYVGAMKGVIAAVAHDVVVDDVSHDIPPGDVHAAAWALGAYWRRYPEGSVHLVVVDPGVGTARGALAIEADGRFLVGPDNGVLGWALRDAEGDPSIYEIEPRAAGIAATFHGRDLFAPAAARLAAGESSAALGPAKLGMVRLAWPDPVERADGVDGVVVHVDRFGNLVTNLTPGLVQGGSLRVGRDAVPFHTTYGDVASGDAIAYIGSRGLLEIAIRDGSAAARLGGKGSAVRIERR